VNVKAPSTSSPLRWIPIAGLVVLLLLWSWATQTGRLGYRGILTAPPGSEHVLSLFEVGEVRDDGYRVFRGQLGFDVAGNPRGLSPGQEVTVGVRVDPEEGLVEQWRVLAASRPAKRRLGYLGLALAAVVGAVTLRVRPSGVSFRG